MKHLTCLFTHNRPVQLRNAIRSLEEFGPNGDVVIYDDRSTDPETVEMLAKCNERQGWNVVDWLMPPTSGKRHGNFFHNLHRAMEYAIYYGYDSLCTMEDDQQWLWRDETLLDRVAEAFRKCPDASQVSPLFFRRMHVQTAEYIASVEMYRTNRGFLTTGFWNLELMRKSGFRVLEEEAPTSGWLLNHGYRLYWDPYPSLGVLPGNSPLLYRSTYNMPILTPLNSEKVRVLRSHDWFDVPYQEHFSPSRLVWHQKGNRNRFYALCRQRRRTENWLMRLSRWGPPLLPPLEAHLNWAPPVESWRSRFPWPEWMKSIRHFNFRDWWAFGELEQELREELNHVGMDPNTSLVERPPSASAVRDCGSNEGAAVR